MGVLKGGATIKASEDVFVYSEDPDVKPVLGDRLLGCGWVRKSLIDAPLGRDADVVTLRSLDPDERSKVRDLGAKQGAATAAHKSLYFNIVMVECTDHDTKRRVKLRKPSEIRKWADALAQQDWPACDLLSQVGTHLTIGRDPDDVHGIAREVLGYEAPPKPRPEEVADGGGDTKSNAERGS
ncbi:MAG: hypothetical protein IT379_24610 [Deltaproteobacteria bacterium]|nr:hypothetical protein [Deltaproteobacteria bacterium]